MLDYKSCYEAVKSKDARFDGKFFTAVKTTKIYCRPICKVPAPKEENCDFYETSAEAEAAGFRPCMRCRPELAPEFSEFNQETVLIGQCLRFFEKNEYGSNLIKQAAEELGISERHIHRLFVSELGVSPKQYIMTKRLLNAKNLLQSTNLSVTEIAGRVGFGSQTRLTDTMKLRYGITPRDLRKSGKRLNEVKVKLGYRPPYDWDQILMFFKMRAIPGVEWVTSDGLYRRILRMDDHHVGWIELKPNRTSHYLELKVSESLEPVLLQVIEKVKRVFDLSLDPLSLPMGIERGTRLPGSFDAFEMSVRAVIGQQISVVAATTLMGRLVKQTGTPIQTPWEQLSHVFPKPKEILVIDDIEGTFGSLGIIRTRSQTIYALADEIESNRLNLDPVAQVDFKPERIIDTLIQIKGIGRWTAEYITMRALSWPDVFLNTDLVIKQNLLPRLKDTAGTDLLDLKATMKPYGFDKLYMGVSETFAEAYRPWRSYLTLAIWRGGLSDDIESR